MIHSTARTDHPVKQGLWGSFEVFMDTLVVCTITGLIVIITGEWSSGLDGATLALTVFEHEIGWFGRVIVALSIFLLGLTSSTGWYSYYEVLLRHLLGNNSKAKDRILKIYKWVYPIPELVFPTLAVARTLSNTLALSADVVSSYDPNFPDVFDKRNTAHAGRGVALVKETGSEGKNRGNDANSEYFELVRRLFDDNNVKWQIGELGKVDQEDNGTIAYMIAAYGIEVIDCGVPVLSMHAPYEAVSKVDVYMAYKGYKAFYLNK